MSSLPLAGRQNDTQLTYMETYRLTNIPKTFDVSQIKDIFNEPDRKLIRGPISLSYSISASTSTEKIATVTFSEKPSFAAETSPRNPQSFKLWKEINSECRHDARNIRIDNSFEGLTPLNDVDTRLDTVDIVACTGIYGRAFVSWQHQNGTMWLRDKLPNDLPNCRVFIWGKHSQLHPGPNPSHGDITHYRDSLIDDLRRLRNQRIHKYRPLVLLGHSFGGILTKAAFVKLSQDPAYLDIRNTLGGLVFFATPHEGIYNQPWLDVWGEEPSQKLVRDLGPGSSLLRDLRENFSSNLQEEKVLTVFELHETATVREKPNEPGKQDKRGPPALMIDEKASCINHPNEIRIPFHGDHSKIAKLPCGEGCIYYSIMIHLPKIVDFARLVVYHRTTKHRIIEVLSNVGSFIQQLLGFTNSALLMAELSELDKIKSIFHKRKELFLKCEDIGCNVIFEATSNLQSLCQQSISKSLSTNTASVNYLTNDLSGIAIETSVNGSRLSGLESDQLARAFVPSIIKLKQSLCAVLGAQESGILQNFINSTEAKFLGLDFVVDTRELWSNNNIEPAKPLVGRLTAVHCKRGLHIATWYPEHGTEGEPVICEYRNYAIGPSDNVLDRDEKKVASQELATILQNVSRKCSEANSTTTLLDPTMSIFKLEGYVDEPEHERLTFMYAVPQSLQLSPRQIIDQSMTLDKWLRPDEGEPRARDPRLEERFAIAYHLCRSVFSQHICGWVHKSIRPNNVVLIPSRTSGLSEMDSGCSWVPYLKGFEHARALKTVSDLRPLLDTENDIYRHPNRRGTAIFDQPFHPIHDIYAVGTVLLEIGLTKSVRDTIKKLKPPSEGLWEEDLVRIAEEKLPRNLGTQYRQCVIKCLRGYSALGVDKAERDSTKLAFAFRNQVVDELMRMAVACGYVL